MTKKQAKRSNQARQHKKGARDRARKRRNQHMRSNAVARVKNIKKNPPKKIENPHDKRDLKWSLIMFWGKVQCAIGIHRWNQSSGLPNTPQFMCRRCLKESKVLWPEK